MAKHARNSSDLRPHEPSVSGYTYPDGTRYGARPAKGESLIPDANEQDSYLFEGGNVGGYAGAAGDYSRENYVGYNALSGAYTKRLRKRRRRTRIAGAIVTVLLLGLAAAGFGAWRYLHQADERLGFADTDYGKVVAEVLSDRVQQNQFYALIIGGDTFDYMVEETDAERGYSDAIMLARVDLDTKTVSLISIPRDTPWQSEDGTYEKINSSYHQGGAAGLVKAVEQVTGVEVNHVAEVHMDRFADFVDSIGGLRYEIPMTVSYRDKDLGIEGTLEAGEHVLTGMETVQYVRVRKAYEGNQDAVRQSNVRSVIKALYDQILAQPPTQLPETVLAAAECVDTDLTSMQLLQIVTTLGSDATFYSATGPVDGDVDPATDNWLCYYNPDGWARLIAAAEAGQDPGEVTFEEDAVTYPNAGTSPYE